MKTEFFGLLCSTASLILVSGAASAQTAPSSAAAAPQDTSPVDIIVTATRRPERLQDIPVAVTAVSGKALEASNFTSVTDLQFLAPSVSFTGDHPSSDGGGFAIRGVGTQAYNYGTEQTVGTVVDGVVIGIPRDPGSTGFSDIDRVEVLRGPQGTLFGKNASAGVVSIVTARPNTDAFSINGLAHFGSRDDRLLQGNVNVPLSDSAAIRVSSFYQNQDGGVPSYFYNWHAGDRDSWGVRGKILFEPTDDLSILLTGEYQHQFSRDLWVVRSFGTAAYEAAFTGLPSLPSATNLISYQNEPWTAKTNVQGYSGEVNYSLGDYTITSITAYRKLFLNQTADGDAAPINFVDFSQSINHSRQVTQEIRLTSPSDGPLQYVLGAFYFNVHVRADETQVGALGRPLLFSLNGGTAHYGVNSESAALFGQGTYRLLDKLRLVFGLRYTHDDLKATVGLTPAPATQIVLRNVRTGSSSVSNDNVSGRAGLQFDVARDIMAYGTYARGYKGPSINLIGGLSNDILPETANTFEVGLKTSLFNRRATLNIAVFSETFKNFQASGLDTNVTPPAFQVTNAGRLRTRGVEVEFSGRITHDLTIGVTGAYNDAKYLHYISACYGAEPLSNTVGTDCYVDPATGLRVTDNSGFPLPNAPKWTYTLSAAYDREIADGLSLHANANWAWRSSYYAANADPGTIVKNFGLLNGTVAIADSDGHWSVGVYARNLLNKRFVTPSANSLDAGGYFQYVSPLAYRTIGLELKFGF